MSEPESVSVDVATTLGRVRVRVAGPETGEAMLLWPSLLMDHTLWAAQVAHFSDRYRMIAVDPPGQGASGPLAGPFTFAECAEVMIQILDRLGVERAHLVGNSWGSMIGGTVAARYPERVRTAVLMNGTATPAPARQRLEYGALVRAGRLLGGFRGPFVNSAVQAFLGPTSIKTRPAVRAHVAASVKRNDIRSAGYAITSIVPRRPDQRALLGSITAPVLVIAGAEDATFPVPEVRTQADAIPGARFALIEDAAHLVALEVPDQVNALLAEFLSEV